MGNLIQALQFWRTTAIPGDEPKPSDRDIALVVSMGARFAKLSAEGEGWRGAFEHLEHEIIELDTPMIVALRKMPEHVKHWRPAASAQPDQPPVQPPVPPPVQQTVVVSAPDQPPATLPEQRFIALAAMRAHLERTGALAQGVVPDGPLQMLANAPVETAEEIRTRGFFPALRDHADAFADALAHARAGFGGSSGHPDAASLQTDPVPGSGGTASHPDPGPLPDARPERDDGPHRAQPAGETPERGEFADLQFPPYLHQQANRAFERISVAPAPGGALRVSWPVGDLDGVHIDRLVSSDENPPYSPDGSPLTAATATGRAIDSRPFDHAVRYYQVWRHVGRDVQDAAEAQPFLFAVGHTVAAPMVTSFKAAESTVIGIWRAHEGTGCVAVFRILKKRAFSLAPDDLSARVQAESPLLGGVTDVSAVPGETYVYNLYAEADILDQTAIDPDTGDFVQRRERSALVSHEVSVPQEIPSIDDLRIDLSASDDAGSADGARFSLRWTRPPAQGRASVRVYLTEDGPLHGAEGSVVSVGALERQGLHPDALVEYPIVSDGELDVMRDIPWPRDKVKASFTVVAVLDDQARIGNTMRTINPPPVRHLTVTERHTHTLVSFTFPEGASDVRLYAAPAEVPAEAAIAGKAIATIDRKKYENFGSLRIPRAQMPFQPMMLHAVAVTPDGREVMLSKPSSCMYSPLVRYWYDIGYPKVALKAASATPILRIFAEYQGLPIGFVLAFRRDRLPLSVSDAERVVTLVRDGDESGFAAQRIVEHNFHIGGVEGTRWKAEPRAWADLLRDAGAAAAPGGDGALGYLRLFADEVEHNAIIALQDPSLRQLTISRGPRIG